MTIIKKILEERAAENLVELDESAEAALAKKSKESGVSLSTLKTVYKRGVAAWNSGHRPGTTPQQWGMARVNSYVTKGKGTYHGADKDLHEDSDMLEDTRLDNKEYHKDVSASTAKARVAHWKKMDKLSDRDPRAYEPAPGDATAKTKESKYTKKYRELYGEEVMYLEDLDEQIEWLSEMPGANMDTRAVHQHLKKSGWTLTRTGGGHDIYTHPSAKHSIPVPRHRQLKAPLVLGILKASKIKEEVELTEAQDDSMDFTSLQVPGKSTKKSKEDVETTSDYKTDKRGHKYRTHKIVFNKGEEEMKEELKGKQHKLDVDKDGKIEGEDLAKLRKMKKEDTELDERELTDAEMKERERIVKGMKKSFKDFKSQYGSRGKEVMYATATKLAKEEYDILEEIEQIEELSKSTLGSYIKKAARSASAKSSLSGQFGQLQAGRATEDDNYSSDYAKSAQKRIKNIGKATDRLTKEELELDEAIKPYVSGDHASGWSVLDSKGKEVKRFHHSDYADHPIADKKAAAKNDAMAYLKKNFSKLSEETLGEMTRGKEYTKAQLMDKIKSGNWEATTDIKPGKHVELRHHSGKRVVVQVKHDISEMNRPCKNKFAESVDILLSLSEEEFNEIMEGSSLDEIVVSLCNLSEEELKELKG